MTYRISETAIAAKKQHELLNTKSTEKPPLDYAHVERVARAMNDYRFEHINEPLSRLWYKLAIVALETS